MYVRQIIVVLQGKNQKVIFELIFGAANVFFSCSVLYVLQL